MRPSRSACWMGEWARRGTGGGAQWREASRGWSEAPLAWAMAAALMHEPRASARESVSAVEGADDGGFLD